MLVFSICTDAQATAGELESTSLPFCYLDGSTKDRMAQVDRFQEDESVPVFLISLKAGGTGTQPDWGRCGGPFDPWWRSCG